MLLSKKLASFIAFAGLSGNAVLGMMNETVNSQVRLAYATDSGMIVSWNTLKQLSQPTVRYGRNANNLCFQASSSVSITYNTSLTYHNHVALKGLKPDTTYYYLPSDMLADNTTTPPYSFRTSRSAGDGTPYSAAVLIDLGTMGPKGLTTSAGQTVNPNNILKPGENNTMQSLEKLIATYDFMLHRTFFLSFPYFHSQHHGTD